MQRIAVAFRGVDLFIDVKRGARGTVMWKDGAGESAEEKERRAEARLVGIKKIHRMALDYLRYLEAMSDKKKFKEASIDKLNCGLDAKSFFGCEEWDECLHWFLDAGMALTLRRKIFNLTPQGAVEILRGKSGAGYVER